MNLLPARLMIVWIRHSSCRKANHKIMFWEKNGPFQRVFCLPGNDDVKYAFISSGCAMINEWTPNSICLTSKLTLRTGNFSLKNRKSGSWLKIVDEKKKKWEFCSSLPLESTTPAARLFINLIGSCSGYCISMYDARVLIRWRTRCDMQCREIRTISRKRITWWDELGTVSWMSAVKKRLKIAKSVRRRREKGAFFVATAAIRPSVPEDGLPDLSASRHAVCIPERRYEGIVWEKSDGRQRIRDKEPLRWA